MAAVVACAPAGCGFEQDCTRCHDPALRELWACDAPAKEPIAWIDPCPQCGGKAAECDDCKGAGKVPVFRCPHKLVSRRELEAVQACALVEVGHLPDDGGWQDQAATFTAAYPLVMQEIQHWRGVARDQALQRAKQKK